MKSLKITFYLVLAAILFNACKKEYSLEGGGLKVPSGSWEFKDSLKQYLGDMDTAYIVSSAGTGTKELHLLGTSADGTQSFHMHLFADTFRTGTYKASLFQSAFEYAMPAKTLYQADELIGEFIVTVTSFSGTVISGTFSGAALDSANKITSISLGKFTSTIGTAPPPAVSVGVFGDSSGTCKPVTLAGSYSQGIALTSANTVQVQVVVATAGTYTITSNTVNGVTFSKSGTFTSTGTQAVLLNGSGTPTGSGNQSFTMSYGNDKCAFNINFGVPAAGALGGGGGNCTPVTLAGVYTQGVDLNASNTVQIQVNVTPPGDYTISTNTVNGVSFTKSGTFTAGGIQNVILTGSGKPVNAGVQAFVVNFGTSSCNFNITFDPGAVPTGDYFPLTVNSHWTFSLQGGSASDDVYTSVIAYSPTIAGNTYGTIGFFDVPPATAFDSSYYRKTGGDYYQYANYSNFIPFDGATGGEFIFLKDNVAAGTSWSSPTVSGTVGGLPLTAFITMTILEKSVPVTIGAVNFPDVIKVKYEYFVSGSPIALETDERWFARNVGEIHESLNDGVSTDVYDIGAYQVFP